MNGLSKTTIWFLLAGGILLLAGALSSVFAHSRAVTVANVVSIVIGLILLRAARARAPRGIGSHPNGHRRDKINLINKIEVGICSLAALLFICVIICGLNGYFNDILTYAFAVAFAIAVIFWFIKRVLRR